MALACEVRTGHDWYGRPVQDWWQSAGDIGDACCPALMCSEMDPKEVEGTGPFCVCRRRGREAVGAEWV